MKATIQIALAAALLLAGPGGAKAEPALDDPEAVVVEELIVRGRLPGPAWWRVRDGDRVVYVMGLPDGFGDKTPWDRSVLERRLKGAHRLITPPTVEAGANPLAVPGLVMKARRAVKDDFDPARDLPPETAARFVAAARAAGETPQRYSGKHPWFVGMNLVSDYRKRAGLGDREPMRAIRAAARRAKVKAVPAFVVRTRAVTLIEQADAISDASGRACLTAALAEVEAGDAAARAAARAWAQGDPRAVVRAPRAAQTCLLALPLAADAARDAHGRMADAVDEALQRPGHAVAVLPLRALVAENGVLDRLRARGRTVLAPE